MKVKTPAVYVTFRVHNSIGGVIAADNFYKSSWPVTPADLIQIKTEIAQSAQAMFDNTRAIDKKGATIVGAPKPQVTTVEICCVVPAEIEEEVVAN